MDDYKSEFVNAQYTILIVDDDIDTGEVMSMILREEGYRVQFASDIQGAEAFLKTLPDLIFLDLKLGNTDGGEFCKRIKGDPEFMHIPVIITSAAGDFAAARAKECKAEDCLFKPFNIAELDVMIDRFVK